MRKANYSNVRGFDMSQHYELRNLIDKLISNISMLGSSKPLKMIEYTPKILVPEDRRG